MGVCLIFIEGIINIGDTIATLETGIRELLLLHHNFFFPLKKKPCLILLRSFQRLQDFHDS